MQNSNLADDENMQPEYGEQVFERGIRGKYFDRYNNSTNMVRLDPVVRAAFPTDESVNDALKMLINLAQKSVNKEAN